MKSWAVALVLVAAGGCGGGSAMPTSLVGTWRVTSMSVGRDNSDRSGSCLDVTNVNDLVFGADMAASMLATTTYSAGDSRCAPMVPERNRLCVRTDRIAGRVWSMSASSSSANAITILTVGPATSGATETQEVTGCADASANQTPVTMVRPSDQVTMVAYDADADTLVIGSQIYRRVTM